MLFGLWWRSERPPRAPSSPGPVTRIGTGLLVATPPAHLHRERDVASATLRPAPSSSGDPATPDVTLDAHSLTATAGAIPQYPLYYVRSAEDGLVAVSTELGELLPHVEPKLDLQRLVAVISGQLDADPAATAYTGIRRLLPRQRLRVDAAGVALSRSEPEASAPLPLDTSPTELARALRAELEASVTRAVGDAQRIVVLVGGGLDSSGLLALALASARGATRREIRALAQVWTSPGDDRPYLRSLEQALGITAIRLPAREAAPWFLDSLCVDAQPQTFVVGCSEMALWSWAAGHGAEVVLGGHGGDEVFGGDVSSLPIRGLGDVARATSEVWRLRGPWNLTRGERFRQWVVSPLVRRSLPRWWRVGRARQRWRKPWMTQRFRDLLDPFLVRQDRDAMDPEGRFRHLSDLPYFGELSRAWGQFAATTGVAPVDPFRDPRLVSFVARIDPRLLRTGQWHRGLFRLAMSHDLPDSVRLRRDKAAAPPLVAQAAVSADAVETLRSLSSLSELQGLGLVEPAPFRATFAPWLEAVRKGERAVPDASDPSWEVVWPLLSVEHFLRRRPWLARGGGDRVTVTVKGGL